MRDSHRRYTRVLGRKRPRRRRRTDPPAKRHVPTDSNRRFPRLRNPYQQYIDLLGKHPPRTRKGIDTTRRVQVNQPEQQILGTSRLRNSHRQHPVLLGHHRRLVRSAADSAFSISKRRTRTRLRDPQGRTRRMLGRERTWTGYAAVAVNLWPCAPRSEKRCWRRRGAGSKRQGNQEPQSG